MYLNLNPFYAAGFFQKPLKTSENLYIVMFSGGYRKRSVAWDGSFILWVRASSRDQYQVWQWMFHLGIISRFGELYSSGCCRNWFDLYDFFFSYIYDSFFAVPITIENFAENTLRKYFHILYSSKTLGN